MSAEVLVVEAQRDASGGERSKALIGRDTTHAIIMYVVGGLCRTRSNMSVVDMMMSPVVEGTHSTRYATVVVGERECCHTTGDEHVIVDERCRDGSRVRRLLISDVCGAIDLPIAREVVAEFDEATCLTEG